MFDLIELSGYVFFGKATHNTIKTPSQQSNDGGIHDMNKRKFSLARQAVHVDSNPVFVRFELTHFR